MSASDNITNFILEHSKSLPVNERASIYRDLATFIPHDETAKKLNMMADELNRVDRMCLEFSFVIQAETKMQKSRGGNNGK